MKHIVSAGRATEDASRSCTAQRADGSFCDLPSAPDAPFPICAKHAARVVEYARDRAGAMSTTDKMDALLGAIRHEGRAAAEGAAPPKHVDVVYYVRVGECIKIGTTTNLPSRLKAFGPSEFLACEPGGLTVEGRRHRQFASDLAAGREWFHPSPALMAWIDAVKDEHPQPKRRTASRPKSVDLSAPRFATK